MYKFDSRLKNELRSYKKYTEISEEIEVAKETICSIMNGKRNCSKALAIAILTVCGIPNEFDYYFERV